jgi:hypothetical protein
VTLALTEDEERARRKRHVQVHTQERRENRIVRGRCSLCAERSAEIARCTHTDPPEPVIPRGESEPVAWLCPVCFGYRDEPRRKVDL